MPFVNDTFTDATDTTLASHTGETGATWTKHSAYSGTCVISDANRVRNLSATTSYALYYTSGTPAIPDYDVAADFVFKSVISGDVVAICGRMSTDTRSFYEAYYDGTAEKWKLQKVLPGSITALGTPYSQTLTVDQAYRVTLQMRGTSIKVLVDGVERISATDTSIATAGRAGLFLTMGSNTTGGHLDNFTATDAAMTTIAVDNASLFFSPYNWYLSGSTYAQTSCPGAYLKTKFSGTSLYLNVDVSPNAAETAANYPTIMYSIDGGAWTRRQLSSADTSILLAVGLASATHTATIIVAAAWWADDRWTTPASVVRVTGLLVDNGSGVSAPTLQSGRMLVFADSNGEGYEALGVGVSVANQDASQATPLLLGRALGCEVGVVAYAGQGLVTAATGGSNVPALTTAWELYANGASRLVASALSPAPDWIVSLHGQNDAAASDATVTAGVGTLASAWRAAAPTAMIVFAAPANLAKASAISAGAAAANDNKVRYVSTGENWLGAATGSLAWSNSNHLSARGHAMFGSAICGAAQLATDQAVAPAAKRTPDTSIGGVAGTLDIAADNVGHVI